MQEAQARTDPPKLIRWIDYKWISLKIEEPNGQIFNVLTMQLDFSRHKNMPVT
jgi:hypothetical protein